MVSVSRQFWNTNEYINIKMAVDPTEFSQVATRSKLVLSRHQFICEDLWSLVARPDREFSRRKCEKCRKFLHKQLKEISPKVRKSKVNVPLFPNILQYYGLLASTVPLFPKTPGRPSFRVKLDVNGCFFWVMRINLHFLTLKVVLFC